ncbi:MAG TPA: cysteine hydrolase [Chloroflexota bacterium]|jgi:nicotinamidase-related amidase
MAGPRRSHRDRLGDAFRDYPGLDDEQPLDPRRSAVIAHHLQQSVLSGVSPLSRSFATAAKAGFVERLQRLLQTARESGALVVYAKMVNSEATIANAPFYWQARRSRGGMRQGTPGAEIIESFAPQAGDLVLEKQRMSAFSARDLDVALAARGIDTLIVVGMSTSMAVESTVREAADRGYRIILVEDCCLSSTTESHEAALDGMASLVTTMEDADRVIARFERGES